MRRGITEQGLSRQNKAFRDTAGVSANAPRSCLPAFKNLDTGEVRLSLRRNGSLAPVHLMEGLPQAWVASRDDEGRITSIKAGIVPGFVRDGCFYTRSEVAELAREDSSPGSTGKTR